MTDFIATRIPYRSTTAFSKTVLDYIDQDNAIKPFFAYPVSVKGIQKAIEDRKTFLYNRKVLVDELQKQYAGIKQHDKVRKNIELLLAENTFTVTTAHQNNIFTGPLYFIYKIIHVIKLADHLKSLLPDHSFVPVFYIGSEDADLDELNHIWLGGEKLVWETRQTGAVGRMKVDKEMLKLIDRMEGQLSVLLNGNEIISMIRGSYTEGTSIQDATFTFVNNLFAEYGLVILLPDNAVLKKQMLPIFKNDLLHQAASGIVEKTASELQEAGYKVQANPREINLFYLKEDIRERIELVNSTYIVHNTSFKFSEAELLEELQNHPERFSPNVILRGLYQEMILPNLAFIGGGGETAYWLQLRGLFDHYKVPFPVLVLRNSFLLTEKKWQEKIKRTGFETEDFFSDEQDLMNKLVLNESENNVKLNGSLSEIESLYETFRKQAVKIDATLEKHVESLRSKTITRLHELEKKMLRAEKRKFSDRQQQIHTIKEHLFPGQGLQERKDNFSYYYAKWGKDFIKKLYDNSLTFEQEFVLLEEK